jgi:hypothetical protein
MRKQRSENSETSIQESSNSEEVPNESSLCTKLERRRRIEDIFEEKRVREELGEYDLI